MWASAEPVAAAGDRGPSGLAPRVSASPRAAGALPVARPEPEEPVIDIVSNNVMSGFSVSCHRGLRHSFSCHRGNVEYRR